MRPVYRDTPHVDLTLAHSCHHKGPQGPLHKGITGFEVRLSSQGIKFVQTRNPGRVASGSPSQWRQSSVTVTSLAHRLQGSGACTSLHRRRAFIITTV